MKGGKPITVNVDQVRIYHPKKRDKGDVETDRSNGERSRAAQGEAEGNEGLAREESTEVEQLQGKRRRSERSASTIRNRERQHHNENKSKRRLPERQNIIKKTTFFSGRGQGGKKAFSRKRRFIKKKNTPSSLQENN
ncbi:hypothetical protein TNIN_114461 [Trichonephila inaurata madagascariensis]|uniref:Uncharacterized protein n=1 Tax=Trichonephila inaurata madagascariensis TaxID=2747483 RepID=A0A8X6Y1V8_9ARAC|nr:hypothetical protein TNIN_114461 [Trichonephila inaurata madagascariensis]